VTVWVVHENALVVTFGEACPFLVRVHIEIQRVELGQFRVAQFFRRFVSSQLIVLCEDERSEANRDNEYSRFDQREVCRQSIRSHEWSPRFDALTLNTMSDDAAVEALRSI
jgi:hypothetical protein